MSPLPLQAMPIPAGIVFGLVGLVLLGLGLRDVRVAVRYRTQRPTPVDELTADSGQVVVSGIARQAEEVLDAPLTGQACLAYGWRAEGARTQRGPNNRTGTLGSPGASGRDAVPFLVDDGSGSVRVDPEGAEFRLAEEWVRNPVELPEAAPGALDRADDLLGIRTHVRRYYESRLDDGETVTVRGRIEAGGERLAARQVGVSVSGSGTIVADATPTAASRRALSRATFSMVTGLFVLLVVGVFVLAG